MIPESVRALYPFTSRYMELPHLPAGENRLHYVDEGKGELILCLHGNPTWSFYYRDLITHLSKDHRVIALDHLGCGASSKPQSFSYQLADHIANLSYFIEALKLSKLTLVLHDWGGPIGLGWAVEHPQALARLVLLNTAAFRSKLIPRRIAFCRAPLLGELLMRGANAFVRAATTMATAKGLAREVKGALTWPYDSYRNRIAIARFVQDIPMKPHHPSYARLKHIEEGLTKLSCPVLLLWGLKDFCFHSAFLKEWQRIYPRAHVKVFPEAGHYLLEDEPRGVHEAVAGFLKSSTDALP